MKRVALTSIIVAILLFLGTAVAIFYARGYRLNGGPTRLEGTGLLVLTSKPDAASVYINGHLTTATNNTINLAPGEYEVKISKDGYLSWTKKVIIKTEIVSRADALLFPNAPKLEAITLTGADHPVVDATGTLVAFTVASASAEKNGVYVLDMSSRNLLNFGASSTQLTDETIDTFSKANLEFSPDSTQLLATLTTKFGETTYLLSARGFNQNPQDVTTTLFNIRATWDKQRTDKQQKKLDSLRKPLSTFAATTFNTFSFSPDEDKILYTASASATLPIIIKPQIIGSDPTPETREVKEGNIYVYDLKEDRNYLLFDQQNDKNKEAPVYRWHADSAHLIYIDDKKINVSDYDGMNQTTIYSGPFEDHYMFPWPDGSRILILTNLNSSTTPINLYTITLK